MKISEKFTRLSERVHVIGDEYEDQVRIGNPHLNYEARAIRGLNVEVLRLARLCLELAGTVEQLSRDVEHLKEKSCEVKGE
jgi:hypothetical protein